jgi:hypothetical protein
MHMSEYARSPMFSLCRDFNAEHSGDVRKTLPNDLAVMQICQRCIEQYNRSIRLLVERQNTDGEF